MTEPTEPTSLIPSPQLVDRATMARDLDRLAAALVRWTQAPLAAASFALPNPIPWLPPLRLAVLPALQNLLPGFPMQPLSAGLSLLLSLPDDDLAALLDAIGWELGAWRGQLPPLPPDDPRLALAELAVRRLIGEE